MRDFFFASATGIFLLKCRKKIAQGNLPYLALIAEAHHAIQQRHRSNDAILERSIAVDRAERPAWTHSPSTP
eukprot:4770510-Prymnesium_polylepis.1